MSSNSSNSFNSTLNEVLKCGCGLPATMKTSMTTKNPGRRYLTCKFYNPETSRRGCNYFKWIDEPVTEMGWVKLELTSLKEMKAALNENEKKFNDLSLEILALNEMQKKLKLYLKVVFVLVGFLFYRVMV